MSTYISRQRGWALLDNVQRLSRSFSSLLPLPPPLRRAVKSRPCQRAPCPVHFTSLEHSRRKTRTMRERDIRSALPSPLSVESSGAGHVALACQLCQCPPRYSTHVSLEEVNRASVTSLRGYPISEVSLYTAHTFANDLFITFFSNYPNLSVPSVSH